MFLWIVFCAMTIAEISIDLYVPALPNIQAALNTEMVLVQLTVSLNLVGIAFSSLFHGILADCYGRRKVFLSGFIIFTAASIACSFIHNVYILILMRFIQGFGAGGTTIIAHASIKDMYSGIQYAKIISRLGFVICLSPAIAPTIGVLILSRFDWNSLFIVISVVSSITLLLILLFFPETLPKEKRETFQIAKLFQSYGSIFNNKTFLSMSGILSCTFFWLWNEIANLPFLFINHMNLDVAYYGYFVFFNASCYMLGTIINNKLLSKIGIRKMIFIGIILTIFPDIFLLILNSIIEVNPIIIALVWSPSLVGLAFVITNSMAIGLSSVPQNATARSSAFLTFIQMASGALAIYTISNFSILDTIYPISVTTIICSVITLLIHLHGCRNKYYSVLEQQ